MKYQNLDQLIGSCEDLFSDSHWWERNPLICDRYAEIPNLANIQPRQSAKMPLDLKQILGGNPSPKTIAQRMSSMQSVN